MVKRRYLTGLIFFVLFLFPQLTAFAQTNDSILVVGGTGRIGSEIVKALEQRGTVSYTHLRAHET